MSLKQIILFLVFTLLSIYTAFLNPHDSIVHITQGQSLKLPTIILLLGSILIGVITTVFLFWTFNFKNALSRWKKGFKGSRIEKNKRKSETLFKKAETMFVCGKIDKAQALGEKVLDELPDHVEALNLMGKIQNLNNNFEQAETLHKKALTLDPQNIHALYALADTYSKSERISEEITLLQKIQEMNQGAVGPLVRLRDLYQKKNDWKKACATQKKVLPFLRDNHEELKKEQARLGKLLVELGNSLLADSKQDSAISEYKQAIRADKSCLQAYLSLGDTYLNAGKQKHALKTWKTGFEKTHHASCLIRSQITLRESDSYQELLKTYEKALETKRDKSLIVLLFAVCYLEHGMGDKAREVLEKNSSKHQLLHSLLIENAKHKTNGHQPSYFELTRNAIFDLALPE